MKYFNKKFVASIFVILIIFSFALKPIPAQAGALDILYKIATEILKQVFLNRMVDQTVTWIQGGGDPKFITDWPAFFQDAVDQAGGRFLETAIGPQICESFRPTLKLALYPVPTFNERTTCTLDTIANNFNNTIGYFKSGNWIAWNQMVSEPQNNVYGAYVMAWDQYEIEKAAAAEAAKSQAQASKGFIGVKKCLEHDSAAVNNCLDAVMGSQTQVDLERCERESCTKWETSTPGALVGDIIAKALGTDFDHIVNADDLSAYAAAIINAIITRMTEKGISLLDMNATEGLPGMASLNPSTQTPWEDPSTACAQFLGTDFYDSCLADIQAYAIAPPTAPFLLPITSAQTQTTCAPYVHTDAYDDCLVAIESDPTLDIREWEKSYMLSSIDPYLDFQNQLLGVKQSDLTTLNDSLNILEQLIGYNCPPGGTTWITAVPGVRSAITHTTEQISQTHSDIIALQALKEEIEATTDISQIPALWAEYNNFVWPMSLQNTYLSIVTQETNARQEELTHWRQALTECLMP